MEDKICPLRMNGKQNNSICYDESIVSQYKCFGEKCAWFIKNESGDFNLAECAVLSLVSIQDIVR